MSEITPFLRLSIIIPTLNEEGSIARLLSLLKQVQDDRVAEIIVADGKSSDRTLRVVEAFDVKVVESSISQRSMQLNLGAQYATGDVLYFVHADTLPPETLLDDIEEALKHGFDLGCYRYKFDSKKKLLKVNSYFTRYDRIMCRGGDQSLFVTRKLFDRIGGYREDMLIMEDYDIITRARHYGLFRIIPKNALVSARKYRNNSYLRVNFANLVVFMMYFMRCSQHSMVNTYKRLIRHPKMTQ